MSIQITVPELGESVVGATVGQWRKQTGDAVAVGEVLVDLETDKVDIEVAAETAGVLTAIKHLAGEDVAIGDVLAEIDPNGAVPDSGAPSAQTEKAEAPQKAEDQIKATPVAQRLAEKQKADLTQIEGSGTSGRITRQDVESFLQQQESAPPTKQPAQEPAKKKSMATPQPQDESSTGVGRREERIRLSRRRRTIAQRLLTAQQTTAMLTTFNNVDMSAVIALRKRHGAAFKERHAVKLGFMSFFVKSVLGGLKAFPRLNAEIDGDDMLLKYYYDIGIAVGAEDGLVVPVVRDADHKSFAQIEQTILDLAQKARTNSLTLAEIRGGTFTITNGGIFGSLLSTPILNLPQVGILGMHRIEERPLVVDGQIVIRPMMYLALSYDHRLIDGREAVQFLDRVKILIEDPETMLLEA